MDTNKLSPILNKEAILKTANARELAQSPNDVLQRYNTYALTHVPLGDTSKQLANLQRVIVENKTCAVGTIVGPYGYGKTSTAVHLWHEIKGQNIIAVPPFLWKTLDELMDAVYHWIHFEFSQGPKKFIPDLDNIYHKHRQEHINAIAQKAGKEVVDELITSGHLTLKVKARDVVGFFQDTSEICEQAGYKGLVAFTDELQATLASYSSRDEFFADLFDLVKDILGLEGRWALVITMDDDTEGMFSRMREDLLQRLQRSALHFRVKEVYNRREYPRELWSAFEKRFDFDGSAVILDETLESIGQIASRKDLGAGPRMVTNAMALAINHYEKSNQAYSPFHFVDDFLAGHMLFDQRGKFSTAVKKALDNPEIRPNKDYQSLIKLLSAYPMGCTEKLFEQFDLLDAFHNFPGLARRELVAQVSGGFILRAISEDEIPVEQIEQRLVKEFVSRFAPSKGYAQSAADGFLKQVLIDSTFATWRNENSSDISLNDIRYKSVLLRGTFDPKYPDRLVHIMTTVVPQSAAPDFTKTNLDADIEIRFELNYSLALGEPSRLLILSEKPQVAIFQLNITSPSPDLANKTLPNFLLEYYTSDQFTPLLCLALSDYLFKNQGTSPDDRSRVTTVVAPLRQFSLALLLGDAIEIVNPEFTSSMVGADRIKDVFRQQCRKLFPNYKTLVVDKNWQTTVQQYKYAIEKVVTDDGISIVRGRQEWVSTKENIADALRIPGRRLTGLETLLDALGNIGLLEKKQFGGRTTSSEVSLLFRLHPLEEEWLLKLDSSRQRTTYKGVETPSLPAEVLFKQSKDLGYTLPEVQEIIHLLIARKYVDLEKTRNTIVRIIDSVDDLKLSVQTSLDEFEKDVALLRTGLPDFDDRPYPTSKLREELNVAQERDEIERIRGEIRRMDSLLNGSIGKRFGNLNQDLLKQHEEVYNAVRQGIPIWLSESYPPSPLSDVLERQKNSLVSAYQSTLDEMRQERETSFRKKQEITAPTAKSLTQLNYLFRDTYDKNRRLKTRLESYQDRRDEFTNWLQIARLSSDIEIRAKNINQVYEYSEFHDLASKLWKEIKNDYDTDPLAFGSRQTKIKAQINALEQKIIAWLENRRSEFDNKRAIYQNAMSSLGINAEVRVPFDAEHPAESVNVMNNQVYSSIKQYMDALENRLLQIVEVTKFAIKIQKIDLQEQESNAHNLIEEISRVKAGITVNIISNSESFNTAIVVPVQKLILAEKDLYQTIRKALKPAELDASEMAVYEILEKTDGQIDLKSLITRMFEKNENNVDLEQIMSILAALFQKNRLDIRLRIVRSDENFDR